MIPRDYQLECKKQIFLKLAEHQSTLVEMATGLGKTCVFAWLAEQWPGRVLVVAHREELIRQAAEKLQTVSGRAVDIEMASERAEKHAKVTVASIQTLSRPKRRLRFDPDHFSLIVVDEGHHAAAVTYQDVLNYFRSAKRLFVTATPKRADGVALEGVCESVAFQFGIEPAIDAGWLVPVQQCVVKVEGLDFSKARTVAEDFNQSDLERILTEEEPLHRMVASAYELIEKRQALWFCASVKHARDTAGVLGRYAGSDNVRFLSGETPMEERRDAVSAYKRGRIQHLLNCALFLEGFDAPATSAIVMGRPTKSLSLYMQVLGRGTRPLPGIVDGIETAEARRNSIALSAKPRMLVIDFAGNAGKHKIVQAADVLGGEHGLPTREYAKRTMEDEGEPVDITNALKRAEVELALEMEEHERRKAIRAVANYQTYNVDPFVSQYNGGGQAVAVRGEPCTMKQARFIVSMGTSWTLEKAMKLSKKQASGVIAKLLK